MFKEYITVGTIVNAHGVRGEMKINPKGFSPEFLTGFSTLYIDGVKTRIDKSRVNKNTVLISAEGFHTMDDALAMKGKKVEIARKDADLKPDEFFDEELMGLHVLDDSTGEEIGLITDVLTYPAHKVYEVKGKKEYLIPAVAGVFIAGVDMEQEIMRIHMMKGLDVDEN